MIELKEMLNVNGNLYIYLRTSQWFDNLFMTKLNDVNIYLLDNSKFQLFSAKYTLITLRAVRIQVT